VQIDNGLSPSLLNSVVKACLVVLVVNALISTSQIDFFSTGLNKPTFFFLEPSHFALAISPFLIYASFALSRVNATLLILFFGFWGLYIQNFTMIISVVMAFILSTRLNAVISSFVFVFAVGITVALWGPEVFSYFTDRLVISGDTDNLSVLVLLQGWENAIRTLTEQSYLGGGFQQFGVTTVYGEISDKLLSMLGFNINQYDGGGTASKIVGEFGAFGIVAIVAYLFGFFRSVSMLRKRQYASTVELFFSSVYVASFLEFFIRGVGYFSPLMYLFCVSIFYFYIQKFKRRQIGNENYS